MTSRGRGLVLGPLLLALLVLPAAAQTPPCARGRGLLTIAALGSDVMQDGVGFGAVRFGASVADVERAWGAPYQCQRDRNMLTYNYWLSDGGDANGLVIGVATEDSRVVGIAAILMPHSGGAGPSVRSGRGVALLTPVDDVRAAYGAPANPDGDVLMYLADGVLFVSSKQLVAGIWIFPPNAPPYTLRPR